MWKEHKANQVVQGEKEKEQKRNKKKLNTKVRNKGGSH